MKNKSNCSFIMRWRARQQWKQKKKQKKACGQPDADIPPSIAKDSSTQCDGKSMETTLYTAKQLMGLLKEIQIGQMGLEKVLLSFDSEA